MTFHLVDDVSDVSELAIEDARRSPSRMTDPPTSVLGVANPGMKRRLRARNCWG